jgi:hypothetical protein
MKPCPKTLIFLLILTLCALPGCFKQVASKTSSQIFYDSTPAIDSESDVELAEQASLGFLKMLEGFYLQSPKDKTTLLMLTRSYSGYAFGFTENAVLKNKGKNEADYNKAYERAKLFYGRARKYGLELLNLLPGMSGANDKTLEEFQNGLNKLGKANVEDLFWIGFAWGNYLNYNKDSVEAIAEAPRAEAIMKRVNELSPGYYYGGPDLFLGVYYGSRPPMLGGNPTLSKEYFDKAIQTTEGKNLMASVTKAQFYAVQTQDAPLYTSLLQQVSQADAAALPEIRLLNELAKIRAQILLDRKSYFLAKETTKSP